MKRNFKEFPKLEGYKLEFQAVKAVYTDDPTDTQRVKVCMGYEGNA